MQLLDFSVDVQRPHERRRAGTEALVNVLPP